MAEQLKLRHGDGAEAEFDDSDFMTEESSASNDTASGIEDREKVESQDKETFEYAKLEIEEPPSFLESRCDGRPLRTMKSYFKRIVTSREESDDDVFDKKIEFKKKNPGDDNGASSSGSRPQSGGNRRTRRSRKPRDRKNENPFFNLKQKSEDRTANISRDRNSELEESTTSVSTVDSCEAAVAPPAKSRRPLKHITITVEDEVTEVKKEVKHEELQISGIDVKFPVKPYSSQIAVMSKLIQGCKKQEHCLLESPTGSGKTLALLCGVLAWQEHVQDEFRKQNDKAAEEAREEFERGCRDEAEDSAIYDPPSPAPPQLKAEPNDQTPSCAMNTSDKADESIHITDDEEEQPTAKKVCRSTSPGSACQREESNVESDFFDEMKLIFEEVKRRKPPTIYYGSRTHRQIEQVVRELKKTAYAYKSMTILSSREFTCIQQTDNNKTETCAKLLDPTKGSGCRFYNENNRNKISSNRALNRFGINGPWDIEDLVELGRQQSACPYFAARDLMTEAEIVFCPYNYLVDPNIRQSMQINLDGQVVILDEAHNIEDMSRDVGSLFFREDKIKDVLAEAETLCKQREKDFQTYNTIRNYLTNFMHFIKVNNLNTVDKFSETSSSDFWTGVQMYELFNIHSLGKGTEKQFQTAAAAAIMDFNTAKEEAAKKSQLAPSEPVITPIAKQFLEDLMLALQMMASDKLANDYRACIIESNVRDFNKVQDNTWVSRGATMRLRTLQMLCMNPAVIFAPLAAMARCVILASGTLSPISSFQSELGTVFPHKLDANHVVPKESVYIRGIPCGPTGVLLKANYANVNAWNFQDELGRLILSVCKVVPHGVLCFFSSYSMMQKQIDRWRQNSCWDQLEKVKYVLQEPRGSSNLEPVMQEFREIIQSTSEGPRDGITGALLLAVFRGKVAEGIDFSDNEARCVMAIGIPFAVRKDPSVDMKYNYNNLNQSKGLLKGGDWYTVQAFRALNQALGRCVRHRNDWGAVLLIDQRFLDRSSYNYLPKWVKTMWRNSPRYNLTQELQQFVAYQVDRTEKEKSKTCGS